VVDKDDGARSIERVVAHIAVLVSSEAVLVASMAGRSGGEARHVADIPRDTSREADLTRRKEGDT
jgi:hypothetical protein